MRIRSGRVLTLLAGDAAAHPLDEAAQARLARAHLGGGRRDLAASVLDAARHRLAAELAVAPGPAPAAGGRASRWYAAHFSWPSVARDGGLGFPASPTGTSATEEAPHPSVR